MRLKIDRYLSSNAYVTGQVLGAAGGDAGGYSAALLGVGWNQPLSSRVHPGRASCSPVPAAAAAWMRAARCCSRAPTPASS